ncbi:MAG TPA: hypothetical protein VFU07_05280 [Candidatus Lumbricidophila sp.]|nr:hypothetical protein [Candidatus Lumbricidophila sp.]
MLVAGDDVITSDRTSLPGRHELDIVVPARGLAVEFNGVYWHSEISGKPADYHAEKSNMATSAGYQLLHIWEDDWVSRREIAIRAVAHKLHALDRLPVVLPDANPKIAERVFARSLNPGESSGTEASRFLDSNHIQGAVVATRHFVLRDADQEIRALLSIRSPRNNARANRAPGDWEIQRYATCGLVVGGFTRLLKVAEQQLRSENTELHRWVSFSANDISDGGMYASAGFEAEAIIPPDYKYVGNSTGWRRLPKEGFQRKRFSTDPNLTWDESWTERIAAEQNGLHRVYDAGKTRWVKTVT